MDYTNFGTAGVKVSRLALGMGLRGQADEAAAQRLIEYALDHGINLIDCANIYGPMDDRANIGRSEVVLGRAIKGRRDQVVITSKVAGAGNLRLMLNEVLPNCMAPLIVQATLSFSTAILDAAALGA